MENILERFPFVAKSIFSNLDNTSLVQAKEVCSSWRNSINSQKFSWIRIIQTHIDDKQELASIWWHRVLLKTSVETVKELSTAVYQFYQFDKTRYYKKKWSPLHITVERDSISLSQHVVSKVDEVDPENSDNITPLHFAASNGNLELFELIFVGSKKKNPKDVLGKTPFYSAAIKGHLEICKFIIKNVEEKNPAIKNGFTPLYVAASNGHLEICKLIIDSVDDKNPATTDGATPLYIGAQNGHLEICEFIIENVDDKNPPKNGGFTPLCIAATSGHLEICMLLIEKVGNKSLGPLMMNTISILRKRPRGWTKCWQHWQNK